MNCGLFESVTGHFLDGTPLKTRGAESLLHSICDNLNRTFNSRISLSLGEQGFDIPDLAASLPENSSAVADAMVDVIKKYEPRLESVEVECNPSDQQKRAFIITARINFQKINLITRFLPGGKSFTSPYIREDQ